MRKIFSFLLVLVTMLLAQTTWAGADLDACWNFSNAGDYPRAIASGKRAVKIEPRNPGSFFCLGKAYYSSGELKLALPEILLGLNQTIMFALSMLVITALVGTRDLGQEVYIALTKADTGRGLVAGLSIAFIAIIADRLISAGARRIRERVS